MFWMTVLSPVLIVLLLWPWRRTVQLMAAPRLGVWGWFDLLAPYLLAAAGALFWLLWHFGIFSFDALNWVAVGLGLVAFGMLGRVLALSVEGEDA